ncbi:MAG: GAF domain-containing protein [Chloroflexi bacterium]|nr:GAF domain-containing protein [Chloroflexota bacterium]
MAKQQAPKEPPKKDIGNALKNIRRQFRILGGISLFFFLIALGGTSYYFYTPYLRTDTPNSEWLLDATVSIGLLVLFGIVVMLSISANGARVRALTQKGFDQELGQLRAATRRAQSLQEMASTMRSTLNLQKVVSSAVDVCAIAMEDMGIPETSLVAGLFLFEDGELKAVADRRMGGRPRDTLPNDIGMVGRSLQEAEPVASKDPRKEPGLDNFPGFRKCKSAVAIPLRVGFQIFGVLILATEIQIEFDRQQMSLFASVADQAVIALRNAQLYDNLEKEKERLIVAETDARNQLARDLHDGPTQSIAAIAMRINFVRSMLQSEPQQALGELQRVEELAKETGKNIRNMLFTLRPLVLETQGLGAAIETIMERTKDENSPAMRMVGGEHGELLNPRAQGVLFYMIEEALGNARKHSRANLIEVRFWQEGGLFVARVQDDGVGFEVDEVMGDYSSRGSLGMINLRERAENIDASLNIESVVGKGTAITIVVPLDKQGASKTAAKQPAKGRR